MVSSKIKTFTDLIAWREGHKLVLEVYKLTSEFPRVESYSLVDQMRRCVISITSNIAEGFSRKSKKEKSQFYYMSLGSTTELQNQLLISKDLGYMSIHKFKNIAELTIKVHKLTNGLIKSSQNYT